MLFSKISRELCENSKNCRANLMCAPSESFSGKSIVWRKACQKCQLSYWCGRNSQTLVAVGKQLFVCKSWQSEYCTIFNEPRNICLSFAVISRIKNFEKFIQSFAEITFTHCDCEDIKTHIYSNGPNSSFEIISGKSVEKYSIFIKTRGAQSGNCFLDKSCGFLNI